MLTTDVYPLGSFLLPIKWLSLWLLIAVGGQVVTLLEKKLGKEKIKWVDPFVQAALLGFIVWRWSPLIWDPISVVKTPQSLLFMSGSEKGRWLAGAVVAGFLGWFAHKSGAGFRRLLDAATITALVAGAGYSLLFVQLGETTSLPWGISPEGYQLNYHPVHFYRAALLVAVGGVWWWKTRGRLREGESFVRMATTTGVGLLVISYFDYYTRTGLLGLSDEQWLFAGLALAGWFTGLWIGGEKSGGKADPVDQGSFR